MSKSIDQCNLLREALQLMTKALELLDQAGTVGAIGAQLDMVRVHLSEHLGVET